MATVSIGHVPRSVWAASATALRCGRQHTSTSQAIVTVLSPSSMKSGRVTWASFPRTGTGDPTWSCRPSPRSTKCPLPCTPTCAPPSTSRRSERISAVALPARRSGSPTVTTTMRCTQWPSLSGGAFIAATGSLRNTSRTGGRTRRRVRSSRANSRRSPTSRHSSRSSSPTARCRTCATLASMRWSLHSTSRPPQSPHPPLPRARASSRGR
mmetsp:Transcript_6424/g.16736  ORF Transcript_6424/g.16736 Transcript_6424/m.16736 type:complete len:211 (-) Transcript_6424:349-981(-)